MLVRHPVLTMAHFWMRGGREVTEDFSLTFFAALLLRMATIVANKGAAKTAKAPTNPVKAAVAVKAPSAKAARTKALWIAK